MLNFLETDSEQIYHDTQYGKNFVNTNFFKFDYSFHTPLNKDIYNKFLSQHDTWTIKDEEGNELLNHNMNFLRALCVKLESLLECKIVDSFVTDSILIRTGFLSEKAYRVPLRGEFIMMNGKKYYAYAHYSRNDFINRHVINKTKEIIS